MRSGILAVFAVSALVLTLSCTRDPVDLDDAHCSKVATLTFCAPQVPLTESQVTAGIDSVDQGCQEKVREADARGATCRAAFQSGLECLADLDCEGFVNWASGDPDNVCHRHRARVEDACGDLPLEPHLGIPGASMPGG